MTGLMHPYELLFKNPKEHEAKLHIPYCHHEKWDGSGYPRGLAGERIPLAVRIFTVVDVRDALSSDRPYRKGRPEKKVIKYIRKQSGSHFDPTVMAVFIEKCMKGD